MPEAKTEMVEFVVGEEGDKVYMSPKTAAYMRAHFSAMPTGNKGFGLSEAADIAGLVFKGFSAMRISRDLKDLQEARYARKKASNAFKNGLASPSTTPAAAISELWDKYQKRQAEVDRLQSQITDTHIQTLYISLATDASKVIAALSDRGNGYDMMGGGGDSAKDLLAAAGLGAVAGGFVSWSLSDNSGRSGRRLTKAEVDRWMEEYDDLDD